MDDPRPVDLSAERSQPCAFFDKLPLEIREKVYEYLLGAEYAKREQNMKSREYDKNRDMILNGPDHTFHFDTAILSVCRRTNAEAGSFFARDNLPIRVTSDTYSLDQWIHGRSRLPVIASGFYADKFAKAAMTIDIEVVRNQQDPSLDDWWFHEEPARPTNLIVHVSDLTSVCAKLCRLNGPDESFKSVLLHIALNSRIVGVSTNISNGSPHPRSNLARLLDPLGILHSFASVDLAGAGDSSYCTGLIADIRKRPSPEVIVDAASLALDEGDEVRSRGNSKTAMVKYKTALALRNSCCSLDDTSGVLEGGNYNGHKLIRALKDIKVRLYGRIAATYLTLGRYRMARIYVERAYGPVRHMCPDRHCRSKVPLRISSDDGGFPTSYAEVLGVAAQISAVYGGDAMNELRDAARLDPNNESYANEYTRLKMLDHPKQVRRENGRVLIERKVRGILLDMTQIGKDRELQGDKAFESGFYEAARFKYEASIAKLQEARHDLTRRYYSKDEGDLFDSQYSIIDVSLLRLYSRMTEVCLELRAYKDVFSFWRFCADLGSCLDQDRVKSARRIYARAYYCKALACEKVGKFGEALVTMMNAAQYDADDAAINSRLFALTTTRKDMEIPEFCDLFAQEEEL